MKLAGKVVFHWLLSGDLWGRWVFCFWGKLHVIWTGTHRLGLRKGRRSYVLNSANILVGRERAGLQIFVSSVHISIFPWETLFSSPAEICAWLWPRVSPQVDNSGL